MKHISLLAVLFVLIVGCSQAGPDSGRHQMMSQLERSGRPPASRKSERTQKSEPDEVVADATSLGFYGAQVQAGASHAPDPANAAAASRKIIFNADLDVVVDNLTYSMQTLEDLVKRNGGFFARSEINNSPGSPRSGSWHVRIPVAGFGDFVKGVAKIGEATKNRTDSDDITDKYFDTQTRIENKKVEVERLQKIVKEQAGKITEVLEVERELSRVTMELEQLKGSLKLWDNQVALSTVSITLHEREKFVSPEAASFAENVSHTFRGSTHNFVAFLQGLTLVIVALTPWLPLFLIPFLLVWLVWRTRTRARSVA